MCSSALLCHTHRKSCRWELALGKDADKCVIKAHLLHAEYYQGMDSPNEGLPSKGTTLIDTEQSTSNSFRPCPFLVTLWLLSLWEWCQQWISLDSALTVSTRARCGTLARLRAAQANCLDKWGSVPSNLFEWQLQETDASGQNRCNQTSARICTYAAGVPFSAKFSAP